MKVLSQLFFIAALAFAVGHTAEAKKKSEKREPSTAELKYCGPWIHGAKSYPDNYANFKPTTLLGVVKDGKFNVQVLARAEGGQWPVIKDVGHLECICMKGVRDGAFMKSVTSVWDCHNGPQRFAREENSESENEFTPRKLIHSNGKAFTECQDTDELEQEYQGRKICVNAEGDYYFLAD